MNMAQFFADLVDEQIDTVTRAVMASTVACARCHDHKFDPFSMTDYYATSTESVVPLAWSKHKRDLFSEMRKAARLFKPTEHMGPGLGVFVVRVVLAADCKNGGNCMYEGQFSPWHRSCAPADPFRTRADADRFIAESIKPEDIHVEDVRVPFRFQIFEDKIEHREKYSMGAGYYLKAAGTYSTGWLVRKQSYDLDEVRT